VILRGRTIGTKASAGDADVYKHANGPPSRLARIASDRRGSKEFACDPSLLPDLTMQSPTDIAKDLALGPSAGTYGILLLYGMTITQAYQYYTNYGSDRIPLKAFVGVILTLESLHLALACHYVYFYLIQHYGETEHLLRIVWSIFLSGRIGFVVAWLVNMFYVRRIYLLSSRNPWLSIFIAALATVRPAFGFVGSSFVSSYPEWAAFSKHAHSFFIAGLSVGLAGDFLIAFTVSYYLLKARDTSIPSTRNIVNLLLWYTINTTAILTFFAVFELVFLVVQPNTLAFFGFFQVQIQLYANCFLTTLNARKSLHRETPVVTTIKMAGLRGKNQAHITSTETGVQDDAFVNTQLEPENATFSAEKGHAV